MKDVLVGTERIQSMAPLMLHVLKTLREQLSTIKPWKPCHTEIALRVIDFAIAAATGGSDELPTEPRA